MGPILVNVPDIADGDLVYDEIETRQILKFFWPHMAEVIDGLNIDNDQRRFAQAMLVAAIDGSYAMSFIDATFEAFMSLGVDRNMPIKAWGKKLARRFVKHWWKHARQRNLEDVRIYESLRVSISLKFKAHLEEIKSGAALRRMGTFYAVIRPSRIVWS